ncbi:haloacid dehalogenase type II [Cellulomonas sp. NS3]|uniref:haloacid dehalogenase type II n=1 Tax=Cellulomonas sp. NS3 TaxID=2973977 RepID=UPI002161BA7A|nr:haloacid dehalogenase type II [Cellulomonas sp. NS3]
MENTGSTVRGERVPKVVVFDVNETLSDMSPMSARWKSVGAPAYLARQWFVEVLRDGFALAAAGASQPFAEIAAATAERLLMPVGIEDVPAAVKHVMAGFGDLDVHPDVPDGVRGLRAAGIRLVTLSNGSAKVADGLLTRAGLRGDLEALLSVDDAPRWKPAPEAYAHAVRWGGVAAAEMLLVAVHPWDIDGAGRVGMRTAWINRDAAHYPAFFRQPDIAVASLTDLAARWSRR